MSPFANSRSIGALTRAVENTDSFPLVHICLTLKVGITTAIGTLNIMNDIMDKWTNVFCYRVEYIIRKGLFWVVGFTYTNEYPEGYKPSHVTLFIRTGHGHDPLLVSFKLCPLYYFLNMGLKDIYKLKIEYK